MDTNTNLKKWLWPVVIGALVAVVLLAVALSYAVRAERNARYVGMMNVVAEKLSKTVRECGERVRRGGEALGVATDCHRGPR